MFPFVQELLVVGLDTVAVTAQVVFYLFVVVWDWLDADGTGDVWSQLLSNLTIMLAIQIQCGMGLADVLIPDLLKPAPYECATLDLTSVGYLHCVAAEATGPLHPRSFRTSPSSSCLCYSWVGLLYTLWFGFVGFWRRLRNGFPLALFSGRPGVLRNSVGDSRLTA